MSARLSEHWRERRERGSRSALRLGIWLASHCNRTLFRMLLAPISLYFLCAAPEARRASSAFLSRALGRAPRRRELFRHFFVFATTLLDRIYLVRGRSRELSIASDNESAVWNALGLGRGCLLLGSHLGSFEVLSMAGSAVQRLPINVVMHVDDEANLRDLMFGQEKPAPYNLIALGQPGSMLRVRECLTRGEVVGILADRVYGNEPTRAVSFFGQPARFSLSPWRLAKITGAPVVVAFALFKGGKDYAISFEEIAALPQDDALPGERDDASFGNRDAADVPSGLRTYVTCLERKARQHPFNWFNFYDYWDDA